MKKINQDNREDIALTGFFEKNRKDVYKRQGDAGVTIVTFKD